MRSLLVVFAPPSVELRAHGFLFAACPWLTLFRLKSHPDNSTTNPFPMLELLHKAILVLCLWFSRYENSETANNFQPGPALIVLAVGLPTGDRQDMIVHL